MTTNLFLERTFNPPLTVADVHARVRDSGWCYEMYKVDWRSSFLSADGRAMICWFAAPDAESARLALRRSGADTQRLWAGTVHEAPESVAPNVLVERTFDNPVMLEQIQSIAQGAAWCMKAHHVRIARTFFSVDRKRMLCFYEAPDAESVRLAQREAAMPVDMVWAFDRIGPDTIPSGPV
jgi:Protein of unknown function (DUF4242)